MSGISLSIDHSAGSSLLAPPVTDFFSGKFESQASVRLDKGLERLLPTGAGLARASREHVAAGESRDETAAERDRASREQDELAVKRDEDALLRDRLAGELDRGDELADR